MKIKEQEQVGDEWHPRDELNMILSHPLHAEVARGGGEESDKSSDKQCRV